MKIKNMQYDVSGIFEAELEEIKSKHISDISKLFTKNKKEILVITKNKKPYHVLTSTDIIDALIAHDDHLNIEAYIEKNPKKVITILEDETVFDAYTLMRSYRIHHLIVVDKNGLFKSVINFYDFASYLTEIALKDEMTGLYNKRFFEFILDRYKKEEIDIGIVFIDLDNFKQINDKYGHLFGDKVIKEVALIIKRQIRDIDYAFRFGGDEFVIMIFGENSSLESVAGRVYRKIIHTEIEDITLKCSMGYAHCPSDDKDFEKVLCLADQRMYERKKRD